METLRSKAEAVRSWYAGHYLAYLRQLAKGQAIPGDTANNILVHTLDRLEVLLDYSSQLEKQLDQIRQILAG